MSSVFPINNTGSQLVNVSMLVEKPCPAVTPVVVTYFQGSPIGWNAVVNSRQTIMLIFLSLFFFLSSLDYYLLYWQSYFS